MVHICFGAACGSVGGEQSKRQHFNINHVPSNINNLQYIVLCIVLYIKYILIQYYLPDGINKTG